MWDCYKDRFKLQEVGDNFQMLQGGSVTSVNGKVGAVVLTAEDVGALPDTYEAPVTSVNTKTGAVVLDAGDIGYDAETTYPDASVGKELTTINSALSSLQSVTEIIDTASGAIASFPDGSGLPMRSLVAQINPVQAGTGDPSPDNIRPISGHTGLSVAVRGKNLLNMTDVLDNAWINTANTNIDSIDGANVFYCDVPKNTTVTYSADKGNRCIIVGYKKRPSTIMGATYDVLFQNGASQLLTKTFDTGDCEFVAFYLNRDQANKPTWIQVEIGSTASSYEAFSGTTTPVSWQSEAGTVYGGTLDVITGVLTVTHQLLTKNTAAMNNSNDYPGWSSSGIKELIGSGYNNLFSNQIMNIGTVFAANTTGNLDILYFTKQLYGKTQDEWKALAIDVQIAVLLATPQTYQLTPQEVDTLLGQNNVWHDANGDTTVTYQANLKGYIDKVLGA